MQTQQWFAKTITYPMRGDSKLPKAARDGACDYLVQEERIEIYHQQYWWRLLKCLQKNFPFLLHIKGPDAFNAEIAVPYLTAHPPSHWALCRLGESLPKWLSDRRLSLAAQIDWAANSAFWAEELPHPHFERLQEEEILDFPITLQPHITLFALEEDLLTMREEKLEEPKRRPCFNVVYRSPANTVCWKEISEDQFRILNLLKTLTISKACAILEKEGGDFEHFPFWFRDWTAFGWFGVKI